MRIKLIILALAISVAPFKTMAQRSVISVDLIIRGGTVVTMDGSRRVIDNGGVAIKGGRVVAVGTSAEMDLNYSSRQVIEATGKVVIPGLINGHTHVPMTLFRGIADDLDLQEWLTKYIFPAEAKNVTEDFVRVGTRLGLAEMIRSGTTTYCDMYYFEDAIADETFKAGMRGVLGETVIGFPVADNKTPQDALGYTEKFLTRFKGDPLVVAAIAPHAVYTVPDEMLKASRALANRFNAPLLIHVSETKKENDDILAQRKMSPTRVLDSLGVFNGRTVAAHCVWVDDDDMDILKRRGVGVAHCPSSNMKLASGVAPVVKMLALDMAVGLGPDGPAGSNNDFSMFEEMDLAAKLAKVTSLNPQALPAGAALDMATIRGARALGLEEEIGSLETGKRADAILVRIDRPHALPLYDAVSQMVYALKAGDVRDVMVNGKPVVRDGRILTLNQQLILQKAEEDRAKVSASVK